MTRAEFCDQVLDWDELMDVVSNFECYDTVDDIYSCDGFNDCINNEAYEMVRNDSWRDLRDYLNSLPDEEYDWWYRDWNGEWQDACDVFDEYKGYVLEVLDEDDAWDHEEPEIEEPELEIEATCLNDMYGAIDDEDFTIGELFTVCSVAFRKG